MSPPGTAGVSELIKQQLAIAASDKIKQLAFSKQHYLMFGQFMISSFSPLCNSGSMKYNNSEIRIQEKYSISSNGNHIKKSRFWCGMERVGNQRRLNHNDRVRNIFSVQYHSKGQIQPEEYYKDESIRTKNYATVLKSSNPSSRKSSGTKSHLSTAMLITGDAYH
ncbi:vacuolar protein-sorting-associated protein [Striga asiatica]|uniref:Vacuolar protein-sorting-associated protein n=1 Tax=Striga asiatica TaxID=4170 RepID=A0A5A7RJP6_STRAF|nr:vacuolar protein-sorting-associated protein [Striga asiatica]